MRQRSLLIALGVMGLLLYIVLPFGLIRQLDVWAHHHEDLVIGVMFAPMPLGILIGSFAVAFSEGGLGILVIRRSSPLADTLGRCVSALRSDWALILPPAVTVASQAALLGCLGWQALHASPPPGGKGAAQAYAIALVLRPQMLAAYLGVGFSLLFSNAMIIRGYLDFAKGRSASLPRCFSSALRQAPTLAALAALLFGGMLGAQFFLDKLRSRLSSSGATSLMLRRIAGFLIALIENGALLCTNMLIVVMLEEGLGPLAAAERVREIVKDRSSDAARAVFGLSAISYEGPATILMGCFGAAMMIGPYFGMDRSIDQVVALWFCGILAGCFFAALIMAFINSLQAMFAAGLYVYAALGETAPQFAAKDFHRVLGDGAKLGARLVV